MKPRALLLLLIFILLFSCGIGWAATVPGADFPYGQIMFRTPPQDSPFPGLGSYYSTLADGVNTMLWNPASLGKLKQTQLSFATISENSAPAYSRKFTSTDQEQTLGGQPYMKMGVYFTSDPNVSVVATREHTAHADYSTKSSALNFKQGFRINDWLSVGIIERGETSADISLSGPFTSMGKFTTQFLDNSISFGNKLTVSIDPAGYATFLVTPEGSITYTQRLDQPLWSGFTQQKSTVPFTTILDARNDISVNAPFTLGGGTHFGNFSLGAAFTPISGTANIDNNVRAVINEGTQDMLFYQPDINADNEQGLLNWANDPNQYGTELGYKRNTIRVPAGEVVAEARYKGFYQATTARIDLGATYDIGDALTLGLVFENLGGAKLDFHGNGRVAYANSRVSTVEAPPLDPAQSFNWSPFSDTFTPISGTENMLLEEEINSPLPKRIRLGFALHKAWLIAVDYEINQTPIMIKYEDKTTHAAKVGQVSNLSFLRTGLEAPLFSLPCLIRGSLVFMFKPTLSDFASDVTDQVNKLFKYKAFPVGLELGTELNFWETKIGGGAGFNGTSLLSLAQIDTLNADISKTVYYNIFGSRGPWRLSYLAAFDPGATALAYANRGDTTQKDFNISYVRYVQTLTVGYTF